MNIVLFCIASYFIYITQVTLVSYHQTLTNMKHEFRSYQHNLTRGLQGIDTLIGNYEQGKGVKISDFSNLSQDLNILKNNLKKSHVLPNSTTSPSSSSKVTYVTTPESSFFLPPTGSELPRFAGIATFMRLPLVRKNDNDNMLSKVQIGIKGAPWDGGTTNRAGARHGPRAIRDASTLIRDVNRATLIDPFQLQNCADLGDVFVNPVDLSQTLQQIELDFTSLVEMGISPLAVGGDHLSTLPVLRALSRRYSQGMALIHFDAHCDTWDTYFSPTNRFTHGTTFRRAIEEHLILPNSTIQIGLRGALYRDARDRWSEENGIVEIDLDEYHRLGNSKVLQSIHSLLGKMPVYITFDIDVLDPSFAPGTGTPNACRSASHSRRARRTDSSTARRSDASADVFD
jgi:guanidinopropionase